MRQKALLASIIGLVLVGCGGGESDAPIKPVTKAIEKDGIYANHADSVVMLIDTDVNGGVLVANHSSGDVIYFDSHTESNETMKTKGLTFLSNNSLVYKPSLEVDMLFDLNSVQMMGSYDGQNLTYSAERTNEKLPATGMQGTHTSADGTEWYFEHSLTSGAGTAFKINANASSGGCTIEGIAVPKKGYYYKTENVSVTGCAYTGENYYGYIFVSTVDGVPTIQGVVSDDNNYIWGRAPL